MENVILNLNISLLKFIRVEEMDLAIVNAWILTLAKRRLGIIKDGAIGVEGDKICFIGPTEDLDTNKIDIIIDGKRHLVMPGLVILTFILI